VEEKRIMAKIDAGLKAEVEAFFKYLDQEDFGYKPQYDEVIESKILDDYFPETQGKLTGIKQQCLEVMRGVVRQIIVTGILLKGKVLWQVLSGFVLFLQNHLMRLSTLTKNLMMHHIRKGQFHQLSGLAAGITQRLVGLILNRMRKRSKNCSGAIWKCYTSKRINTCFQLSKKQAVALSFRKIRGIGGREAHGDLFAQVPPLRT
jgi:hypothetical protein